MLTAASRQARPGGRYRIGEWHVAPALNEIRRGAESVRLEPRAMEVLVILAERAGDVVAREDLLAAVWPGVVVGDDALTQAVIKLRKALGDAAREPKYIETIAKRGYRLLAPVALIDGQAASEAARREPRAETAPASSARTRSPRAMAGISLGAVALIVGTAWFFAAHHRTPEIPTADVLVAREESLPTVAVVPFESLGGGTEPGYLARGLAADLATEMSRFSALRVIAASRFDEKSPPARYVVSGSVQRAADQLDVNVRLSDAASGRQLWAERYTRHLKDLFAVQQEIIDRLIKALPVTVSEAERRRAARRYTRSLEAYDDFLRAKSAFLARTRADNESARALYLQALKLDPGFARAYAGLALTYTADYRSLWTDDRSNALARATELAQTALRIDPEIPEVYWVLAYLNAMARKHEEAINYLNQAIALDRSYADAYAFMGALYTHIGQPQRAIPPVRTAMRLNPEAGFIYFLILGRAYLFQGDSEQASINLQEALARNPTDLEVHVFMAATLVALGKREAAGWEAEEIRGLQADFSTPKWLQTYPMTDEGQKRRLILWMAAVGL
jgi:DNA-binding winged helix-turn-helix (wHTH) protein/TolB-like protein/Tfp pilus assembly protein PilF